MASSLTGIFAPGSPALAETLRTLVVEPKRTITPGETIRAEFSFSNLGGAPATGVRVRFAHPQGVVHVVDADTVDERPLPHNETFAGTAGAEIGDLEPNGHRRVSCSFRVNDIIEDGSELVFQAALVTDQTPLAASNVERLVVRSRPELRNSATLVTIVAPEGPKPGSTITVRATIVNTGSSSANEVVLNLPSPDFASYVARSARIDGRVLPSTDREPFDYDTATIVSERLAPGATVVAEYQVTIDSPLPDGTRIKAAGTIGSREVGEFAIASAEIVVDSPVDFEGEETSMTVLCDDIVTPGMRVPIIVRAVNAGTGVAEHVSIAFSLPQGLVYAPGSAHVDGQPVSDEALGGLTFGLGALPAGRVVEIGLAATVAVPHDADPALPVAAALRWKGGSRTFSRRLTVRVASRFNRARNYVEADRGIAQAREDVEFTVHVYNDGTAPERNVRVRLIPGVYLDDVRVSETEDEPFTYAEPIDLGMVQPHNERFFSVKARVSSKVPDRSNVTLGAVLEFEGAAVDLGVATVVVRSRPVVTAESVAWELATREPLRPHRSVDLVVRFTNSGSDILHDARLMLALPAELAVERAVEARRDRDGLLFGDIAPESTHEARLTLRLLRPIPRDRAVTLEAWLHGRGISPVQFPPLDLTTYSEPAFEQTAHLSASPPETVNAGERANYEVRLRNDGDGPADRLLVRVVPTNLAVYVPGSTTINGMTVPDDAGTSALWSQSGLNLADVNPGVELRVRWEMVVMSPLPAGTPLETRAVLEWDDGRTLALAAPTLHVQARPSLGETSAGTPISIARMFPAEAAPFEVPPLPEPEPEYVTPAAEPPPKALAEFIARHVETRETQPEVDEEPAALEPTANAADEHEAAIEEPPPQPLFERPQIAQPVSRMALIGAPPEGTHAPILFADYAPERLANTIRMLERSEAGGLVQHLFAMRLLFPENAVGATSDLAAAFAATSRALRAPLEHFFVRLRTPRLAVTGKDLEDRESRDALRALVEALVAARGGVRSTPPAGAVRVEGPIDVEVLRSFLPQLESAPIGSVTPWLINAHMLGTEIHHDGTSSEALGRYRRELINVFFVLSELPIMEFHRVLTSSVNRTLDEALAAVLDALRSAAHIAVD